MKNMDYAERLEKLDLPTLLHRRERGDMIQVWKHFNTYDPSTLAPNFRTNPRSNRKHCYQLIWNRSKDGLHGIQTNSFYFRTANAWNNLRPKVVEAKNIHSFKKSRFDDAWFDHPTKRSIDNTKPTTKIDSKRLLSL